MLADTLGHRYRSHYESSPFKLQIDRAMACVERLNYRPLVILNFFREWIRFAYDLALKRAPLPVSSEDPEVEEFIQRNWCSAIPRRRKEVGSILRILIETNQKGSFDVRKLAPVKALPSPLVPAGHDFLVYLQNHRTTSPASLRWARYSLKYFGDYLDRHGLRRFEEIQGVVVRDYTLALVRWKPKTRGKHLSTLRALFRWAYMTGLLRENLATVISSPRTYRDASIPEILSPVEARKVLAAVDRSKPAGLRDYAILLLAARYGLRPCDIRQLSLDHIDWRKDRIKLVQAKTNQILELPLLPDVATSLIAYLKRGRPPSKTRNIFLGSQAPYRPFGSSNNLHGIMKSALAKAGLLPRRGQHGLYLLRHTLAGTMLASGQPLKEIADVLGHSCLESTFWYTKADVEGLRAVAVSLEEVLK